MLPQVDAALWLGGAQADGMSGTDGDIDIRLAAHTGKLEHRPRVAVLVDVGGDLPDDRYGVGNARLQEYEPP